MGLLLLSTRTLGGGLHRGESVEVSLCEGASLPGLLVYLWFGVLSETGSILPPQLQRGGWKRENQRRSQFSKPREPMKKARGSAHPRLPTLLPLPHPWIRWPPGASVPSCSPEGGEPASPGPGPLGPTGPAGLR